MSRYFFTFFIIILISCNSTSSQKEKEYIKNLEEKNKMLEKELQELKSKTEPVNTKGKKKKPEASKEYFTIGSTLEEVLEIMGDPTSFIDLGFAGKQVRYGLSIIYFENGKVVSYSNTDGSLKVKVKM